MVTVARKKQQTNNRAHAGKQPDSKSIAIVAKARNKPFFSNSQSNFDQVKLSAQFTWMVYMCVCEYARKADIMRGEGWWCKERFKTWKSQESSRDSDWCDTLVIPSSICNFPTNSIYILYLQNGEWWYFWEGVGHWKELNCNSILEYVWDRINDDRLSY